MSITSVTDALASTPLHQEDPDHDDKDNNASSSSPLSSLSLTSSSPVLHVLVIGFHHKKGCHLEYAYPPLTSEGDPHAPQLPSQWRHLPSLALPDGSHNFTSDTCYFHLPSLTDPRRTIYGISCYRQLEASKVINSKETLTRGFVQKSVCVLSQLPLFGHIAVKMALITEAFFREADFTQFKLINETRDNLNACLENNNNELMASQQLYVGLDARALMMTMKERVLILFKLLCLERKVVFFKSPVKDLNACILTLLSLHPAMLEQGLNEAARIVPPDDDDQSDSNIKDSVLKGDDEPDEKSREIEENKIVVVNDESEEEGSVDSNRYLHRFTEATTLSPDEIGLPLRIFSGGNLCHPFLSLSMLDSLSDSGVHGYIIGATNVLFKQKRDLAEVLIDLENDRIEINDPELRKALMLTTEDLRFVDHIVQHVQDDIDTNNDSTTSMSTNNGSVLLDGVGWEGGDEWIRAHFKLYLLSLMRSTLEGQSSNSSLFNSTFVSMWQKTNNYKFWRRNENHVNRLRQALISSGHPCEGQLSVADVRRHWSNTLANSEGGRRVTQAVASTGKAVAAAKGVFANFINSALQQRQQNSITDRDVAPVHQKTSNQQQ